MGKMRKITLLVISEYLFCQIFRCKTDFRFIGIGTLDFGTKFNTLSEALRDNSINTLLNVF